ncbi:hypothetical protein Hanom_Chr09g00790801 [Helianthus anomalus]
MNVLHGSNQPTNVTQIMKLTTGQHSFNNKHEHPKFSHTNVRSTIIFQHQRSPSSAHDEGYTRKMLTSVLFLLFTS